MHAMPQALRRHRHGHRSVHVSESVNLQRPGERIRLANYISGACAYNPTGLRSSEYGQL